MCRNAFAMTLNIPWIMVDRLDKAVSDTGRSIIIAAATMFPRPKSVISRLYRLVKPDKHEFSTGYYWSYYIPSNIQIMYTYFVFSLQEEIMKINNITIDFTSFLKTEMNQSSLNVHSRAAQYILEFEDIHTKYTEKRLSYKFDSLAEESYSINMLKRAGQKNKFLEVYPLKSSKVKSRLVLDCKKILNDLASCNRVILTWVPGHSGVPGNEEADRLARLGSIGYPIGPRGPLFNGGLNHERAPKQGVRKIMARSPGKHKYKHLSLLFTHTVYQREREDANC
ncbi:hypothetical protein NQ318_020453 [Aromia moschata]|uniref:RNase H type-1 domain-containing protein n=1 Tax=Aromia moschata TaxID=1265417 RepID=A0AAV8YKX2_9CUCU|nr:hypothetical protein NQ318_020453 [Aromia moschata]